MFDNLGFLLPVWLLGAPLVGALIEYSRTPTPVVRRTTAAPYPA